MMLPRVPTAILMTLCLWVGGTARAQKKFDPEVHLPDRSLVHFSIDNCQRLKTGLAKTLLGRIATHPGTHRAFAGVTAELSKRLADASGPLRQITGKGPMELLALPRGRVTLAITGITPVGPEMVFALELGDSEKEILEVVARLQAAFEAGTGTQVPTRNVAGVKASVWPGPTGSVFTTVLGGHFLVVTSSDLLRSIAAAFQGNQGVKSYRESAIHRELSAPLAVPSREVVLEVNLEAILEIVAASVPPRQYEEMRQAFGVIGIDRLTSLGYALGFEERGIRAAIHLGTRDGGRGVIQALAGGLRPVAGLEKFLPHVPASAHELSAAHLAPGAMLKAIDGLLRRSIPELSEQLDFVYDQLEAMIGISPQRDLFTLPALTLCGFSVTPPAGGFFSDQIALVRTTELEPYWNLLGKLARSVEAELQEQEVGGRKMLFLSPGAKQRGSLLRALLGGELPEDMDFGTIFAASLSVARADMDDGWSVLSSLPQAVVRYVSHYDKGPALAADSKLAQLAVKRLEGAGWGAVFESGKGILSLYNTAVSLAGNLSGYLSLVGVEAAILPPAEAFADAVGSGFLRLEVTPRGITVQSHRALESSTGLLTVAAGGAVLAGIAVPTLVRGRRAALHVKCVNNLKQLHSCMSDFAFEEGHWPHSADGSLAAINAFLQTKYATILEPDHFVCPAGAEVEAEKRAGRKLRLSARNCSYELVPWKISAALPDRVPYAYDKFPHHDGTRMVLYTDGSVVPMEEPEFRQVFETQRRRFTK